MRVRLVASPWMDARSGTEHSRIRIPKRARLSFDVTKTRITLRTTSYDQGLEIKQARIGDIQTLLMQVRNGELTSDEADMTAFVTTRTRDLFLGKSSKKNKEEGLYLTDRIEALKIGADPEFALVNPENMRYQYAQHVPGLTKTGLLGEDGPLAEVRPPPATTPEGLVENMRNILKQYQPIIDKYHWIGGATYKNSAFPEDRVVSMGGHIHIGNPPLLPEDKKNAIYQRSIHILDDTVAIPLVRIDTPEPYLRRNTMHNGYGKYGRWGDQRPQEGRYEYRVLSGLWMTHPDLALAVLGTTKAVSEEVYQRMADNDFSMDYISAPSNRNGLLKSFGVMAQDKAEKIVNDSNPEAVDESLLEKMKVRLCSLGNYEQYKNEIDSFIDIVTMSEKDRSNISLDVKKNWLEGQSLIKQ